jgi:hypothetical protein
MGGRGGRGGGDGRGREGERERRELKAEGSELAGAESSKQFRKSTRDRKRLRNQSAFFCRRISLIVKRNTSVGSNFVIRNRNGDLGREDANIRGKRVIIFRKPTFTTGSNGIFAVRENMDTRERSRTGSMETGSAIETQPDGPNLG